LIPATGRTEFIRYPRLPSPVRGGDVFLPDVAKRRKTAYFAIGLGGLPCNPRDVPPPARACTRRVVDKPAMKGAVEVKLASVALLTVCLGTGAAPAQTPDASAIAGTYLENQVCKGDGSDPADKRIKITATAIDSSFGLCTLQDPRRDSNKFTYQVICKDPAGGSLSSDVNFTVIDATTLDFSDQYETYRAKLYKCPQ
jgi:hypothetical protein